VDGVGSAGARARRNRTSGNPPVVPLTLAPPRRRLCILCLGAHADDIEIGAGGTILRLLRAHPGSVVHWAVFSAPGRRAGEARASARRFLHGAGRHVVQLHGFRDGFFPDARTPIKEVFEALKPVAPDLILTHTEHDRHQDHRVIAELTWNTFRGHMILEYEVPKYDGDLGSPNVFVPLAARDRRRKIEILMNSFTSQRRKRWFAPATFEALMRLRGVESAAREGYAEAFYTRKVTLEP
jgi:LmbE family N-acetylglucosaminyl deacetylase